MHELVWIKFNESKCTVKQWNEIYVAVVPTLVQTRQIRIYINETVKQHSTNNKNKYTYYQNTHTLVKTPTVNFKIAGPCIIPFASVKTGGRSNERTGKCVYLTTPSIDKITKRLSKEYWRYDRVTRRRKNRITRWKPLVRNTCHINRLQKDGEPIFLVTGRRSPPRTMAWLKALRDVEASCAARSHNC